MPTSPKPRQTRFQALPPALLRNINATWERKGQPSLRTPKVEGESPNEFGATNPGPALLILMEPHPKTRQVSQKHQSLWNKSIHVLAKAYAVRVFPKTVAGPKRNCRKPLVSTAVESYQPAATTTCRDQLSLSTQPNAGRRAGPDSDSVATVTG